MTTVTSVEIVNALVIYSVVHLVTAAMLHVLHFIQKFFYSKYQQELHNIIKHRHFKNDDVVVVAVTETETLAN